MVNVTGQELPRQLIWPRRPRHGIDYQRSEDG